MEAEKGSRSINSILSLTSALNGGGWLMPRPDAERDPILTVYKAGWTPEPVWTDAENTAPTGKRSPDRPARSESLIPTDLSLPTFRKKVKVSRYRPTYAKLYYQCDKITFTKLTSTANNQIRKSSLERRVSLFPDATYVGRLLHIYQPWQRNAVII